MSYKNDSEIVILNKLDKADGIGKAELYETYDRLRDLAVSGPTLGGTGLGSFSSLLLKLAQVISPPTFMPMLGNQSINIPGTSYYSPIKPGTGINAGGQSSFGLGPWSQFSGFPPAGSAAPYNAQTAFNTQGIGSYGNTNFTIGGNAAPYVIAGYASAPNAIGSGVGLATSMGFGRSYVLPLAGFISGVGGILTSLSGYLNPTGALAAFATGATINGLAGAITSAYQGTSSRVIANADVILSNKIKNLETTLRALDAQKDVVKKLLRESLEGAKKAIQDLS